MVRWLQTSKIAQWLLLIVRLILGYGWFTAGLFKLIGNFSVTGFINNGVMNPVLDPKGAPAYPWYTWLLENVATPLTPFLNIAIPVAETAIGLALIIGSFTAVVAFIGLLLNFMFTLAGIIAINPTYIFYGLIIFLAGYNAGFIGVDRFMPQFLGKYFRFFNYHPELKK